MPKREKKVGVTEEVEESESDLNESATDEENESEAGESEAEESGEEAPALDASSTESDEEEEEVNEGANDDEEESDEDDEVEANEDDDDEEDEEDDEDEDEDEVDDDEDIPKKKTTTVTKVKDSSKKNPTDIGKSLAANITKQFTQKYEGRKGLQLFIRLPGKLPAEFEELEKTMKSLSPLIVKVHKPRQKSARFCLVDFASKEDREKAYKQLLEISKEQKLVVALPRAEEEGFIEKLVEKRIQKIEKIRANRLLKKEGKKAAVQEKYTSLIMVYNIPKSASVAQIKELFPDAVDIKIKPAPKKFDGVCIAAVTCPSTQDARENQKRQLSLGGNKLFIKFDISHKIKALKKAKKLSKAGEGNKQKINKKPAPKSAGKKEQAPVDEQPKPVLGKKRLSDGDDEGNKQVPEKKVKATKGQKKTAKPPQKKQTQAPNGKAKQNQQQTAKANGKSPQKKDTADQKDTVKSNGEEVGAAKLKGKKPFNKKLQAQKSGTKKAKAPGK